MTELVPPYATPAELIATALEVMDERGWGQGFGDSHSPTQGYCVMQCLGEANIRHFTARCLPLDRMYVDQVRDTELITATHAIAEEAGVPQRRLVHWNDDPYTSEEDVRLAMKRAIVTLEEADV